MGKKEQKRTVDPAAEKMLELSTRFPLATVWDRLENQKPQCRLGEEGICCRICGMGPCRIAARGKEPSLGVCGADVDTIVARNLVRMIAAGASAHSDHGRKPALLLQEIASGVNTEYRIKDEAKLTAIAARLGLPANNSDIPSTAAQVAEIALNCFGKQDSPPPRFLENYMPVKRQGALEQSEQLLSQLTGKNIGLLPRSIDREPVEALHRTHYGTDHAPISLLAQGIRCALADGWGGSLIATELQDVLFGTPRVKTAEANLGVIDKDSVNIVVHGHEPIFSDKIIEIGLSQQMADEARKVGASGVKVIGMCCTVNEVLSRRGVPVAGNHMHQELAVMTGAIEAVVVDVQCIMPSMVNLTRCFHTKFITTSEQALFPGALHIQFTERTANEVATRVIRTAIANFPKRNRERVYIPPHAVPARVGYSVEAIADHLGGELTPLAEALRCGELKGIAGIIGCNNPKRTQDFQHISLAEELIRRDILVVGTGCAAIALAKAGLMGLEVADRAGKGLAGFCREYGLPPILHMGSCVDCSRLLVLFGELARMLDVDISELPVVGSAPEWATEKALAIGTYLAASGVPVHLGLLPPIGGSAEVMKILTEDMRKLLGGFFFVEPQPRQAADRIEALLDERRQSLSDCQTKEDQRMIRVAE